MGGALHQQQWWDVSAVDLGDCVDDGVDSAFDPAMLHEQPEHHQETQGCTAELEMHVVLVPVNGWQILGQHLLAFIDGHALGPNGVHKDKAHIAHVDVPLMGEESVANVMILLEPTKHLHDGISAVHVQQYPCKGCNVHAVTSLDDKLGS